MSIATGTQKLKQHAESVPFILPLDGVPPEARSQVGGKAFSLSTMLREGFPVPGGFVVTEAARARFLEATGLAALARAAEDLAGGEPAQLEDACAKLRERIIAAPMPAEVCEAILEAHRRIFGGSRPVAVRSSGAKEDLAEASFAGQYETLLNVRSPEALLAAVRRCWASLWSPQVLGYAHGRAGGARGLAMGVVVQELVDAAVSGVLFTVDPLSGREDEMVIEAVRGLGESLVSGRANADRFIVNAANGAIVRQELAQKPRKVACDKEGTHEVEVAAEQVAAPALTTAEIAQLADVGARIQEKLGEPLDIEWVINHGAAFVVQARPITRINFAPELGEWTTADFRDGGVSSEACPNLMWSLYEAAFDTSMPVYLKAIRLYGPKEEAKWTRMFFARPYWNLAETKRVLAKVPGYHERAFERDLGVEISAEGEGVVIPVTLRGILRAIPILFSLRREYVVQLARAKAFVAAFEEKKRPWEIDDEHLHALSHADFARLYSGLVLGFQLETEATYFATIYNTSNAMLDFKVQLAKAVKALGEPVDVLTLVSGLEDLAHLRPIQDMHDLLGRLRREGKPLDDESVRAFAQRWRHKSRRELDLRVPRWCDDLEHVREQLETGLATFEANKDPREATRQQHDRYLEIRRKACHALRLRPWDRIGFEKALDRIREYAWWREEMRDHSSYAYYLARRWTVEAGRRLAENGTFDSAEDVWNLKARELVDVLEGRTSREQARSLAAAGRRTLLSFRNFKIPNEIGSTHGFASKAVEPLPGATVLKGTAACAGRVRGKARVARNITEASRIEPGEILVAVFTDPGWTPLMGRIAGVVTENGGVLCHAAVISREYGIPAVLAVPQATSRIHDGDELVVDGAAGTVEVAPRAD
jgi:pyruvate,water dikinase